LDFLRIASVKQDQGTPEVGRMLQAIGLALALMVVIVLPAEAAERAGGETAGSASPQPEIIHAGTASVQRPAPPRPLAMASIPALWSPASMWSAGLRREVLTPPGTLAAVRPDGREIGRSTALPWFSEGKSALRLPVTERLSFGVGYRRLQGEDLWRRYAEAGSVDYDSHDFLLRAHWRF
jgi:hypothetical protein